MGNPMGLVALCSGRVRGTTGLSRKQVWPKPFGAVDFLT